MVSKELIGLDALVIYIDGSKTLNCFGKITNEDELFFTIKTDFNTLMIPKRHICKIKIKELIK